MPAPEPTVQLVEDAEALAFGDLVRLPGRKTWWVVVDHVATGPTGVRFDMPRDLGPRLTVDVSNEVMRRFEVGGEAPARSLALFDPVDRKSRVAAPPLERITNPAAFVRCQPVCPVVVTLTAWHTRDEAFERTRYGWTLRAELERVLAEAVRRG